MRQNIRRKIELRKSLFDKIEIYFSPRRIIFPLELLIINQVSKGYSEIHICVKFKYLMRPSLSQ